MITLKRGNNPDALNGMISFRGQTDRLGGHGGVAYQHQQDQQGNQPVFQAGIQGIIQRSGHCFFPYHQMCQTGFQH
jgi:hypothetical protein